jgi:hypothetical protein
MRGRDVDDARRGRQQIHHQALVIDGDAHHLRAQGAQQAPHRHVPGVLDRDAVAGLEQDPGDQVDGMLGAGGDHHRVFSGRHRSRPGHPAGDGPPQPDPAGRVAVLPVLGGDGGGDPAAPHRGREQRGIRDARPEIEPAAVRRRPEVRRPAREPRARAKGGLRARPRRASRARPRRASRARPRRASRARARRTPRARARRAPRARARRAPRARRGPRARGYGRRRVSGCHHAAAAGVAVRIALGHQAAVCGRDRMPGHAELTRELAARDELISGQQAALGYGPAELLVQLPGQRLRGFGVEKDVHVAGLPPAWYGQTVPFWISTGNHLLHRVTGGRLPPGRPSAGR